MIALAALLLAAATPAMPQPPVVRSVEVKPGTGAAAKAGDRVTVHYTGWLATPAGKRGKKFDSSLDARRPIDFVLGAGEVIPGWDEGIAGLKVGGKRTLTIPPELGYGRDGAGADIPPNATLIFDVELVAVKPAP
ncbi:FKBP-type peptidyl-prolyl cis-trans isomerase [Glacieibacterium frigidum]|uniref:Peptidyl-prolyl cis-trans isomerase n=1 Tax=Glacieibacterium frigidum TaxID=2593303 RepID=A0A552U710_9SPHN|nr:FKBP-type peptidyl-prolyl cis-trans isomerase [Glacieibacterium frigidum]TRW14006.1 FKBP-type peptidyl-prolyl cis-trans isomerase [Glacieibacterium frigidum]